MTILGTRGSDLALWQARHVQALLRQQASLEVTIKIIHTAGDQIQDVSLATLPGKGFFTKEIEEALLAGQIDLAVHSHKDLPTESPPALEIGAVPPRGPATECLLVRPAAHVPGQAIPLTGGALVGTGSARRRSQLLAARPDLEIADLRGNVPTRLRKLADGSYDAIVLASAGLDRLGLELGSLKRHEFTTEQFVPAPAQGALAVQVRSATLQGQQSEDLSRALRRIHHEPTARVVAAERLVLAALEGGCNLPLGAHAVAGEAGISLTCALGTEAGTLKRCRVQGDSAEEAARAALAELTT